MLTFGIGLTMAPATQSVMSSLPPAKTGVGAAVNNTTRNLGTVLGVAVLGSIAATTYTHSMPAGPGARSIGAAASIAAHLPTTVAQSLHATAAHAFVHGADLGALVTAAVVLLTTAMIYRYLPGRH
jgi:hypothetical protein